MYLDFLNFIFMKIVKINLIFLTPLKYKFYIM